MVARQLLEKEPANVDGRRCAAVGLEGSEEATSEIKGVDVADVDESRKDQRNEWSRTALSASMKAGKSAGSRTAEVDGGLGDALRWRSRAKVGGAYSLYRCRAEETNPGAKEAEIREGRMLIERGANPSGAVDANLAVSC